MKTWLLLIVSMVVVSCAPIGPVQRIQENHGKFSQLSVEHQEMVRQGKIAPGMSADGVFLAWGKPSRVFAGTKKGKEVERWDYTGTHTVFLNSLGSDCFGPYSYGPRYGYYNSPFYGPDVAYVPYRAASVWFESGKVDAWERVSN